MSYVEAFVLAVQDPRIKGTMSSMPFDGKRMIFGGFQTFLKM